MFRPQIVIIYLNDERSKSFLAENRSLNNWIPAHPTRHRRTQDRLYVGMILLCQRLRSGRQNEKKQCKSRVNPCLKSCVFLRLKKCLVSSYNSSFVAGDVDNGNVIVFFTSVQGNYDNAEKKQVSKPTLGFEPTTTGLQNQSSTVELRWHIRFKFTL